MFRNRNRSRLNRVITAHEMSPISREDKIFIATFFSRDEKMSRDDRNVVKQGLRRIRKCTLRSCLSVSNVSDNTYKGTWVHGCLNYDLCICIYFFKGSLRKTKKNIPNLPVRYCIIRNTKKLDFFRTVGKFTKLFGPAHRNETIRPSDTVENREIFVTRRSDTSLRRISPEIIAKLKPFDGFSNFRTYAKRYLFYML